MEFYCIIFLFGGHVVVAVMIVEVITFLVAVVFIAFVMIAVVDLDISFLDFANVCRRDIGPGIVDR